MKLFFKICTIFTAIVIINSASISPSNNESENDCRTVEIEPNYYSSYGEESRTKKSNEESPCQGNDSSECTEGIEDPSPLASSQPELEILENIPMTSNNFYGLRPLRSFDWNTPGQRTAYLPSNVPGYGGIPYNGIQYYVQPSLYTPFNPSPAYLPPTVPAYARRPIPDLHRQAFQRPARVIRSREEDDFLSELQHIAMMNNILPTMPIPFLRNSYSDYSSHGAQSAGGATAVYPTSASGCAVPLLFSCTPKITRGIVAKPLPPDYSQLVPPAAPADEYRKQDPNEDTVELKSGVSQSDVTSNDGLELRGDHHDGNDKKEPAMNAIDRALQPKHVAGEKHSVTDKTHVKGILPVHMTSK